jgi:hypothetical protein
MEKKIMGFDEYWWNLAISDFDCMISLIDINHKDYLQSKFGTFKNHQELELGEKDKRKDKL